MSQLSNPDVAMGWMTAVGALGVAATAAGFTSAGVIDRLSGRRIWPLRLAVGAIAAIVCAILTPLAYIPIGDYGAAVGQVLASRLEGGRGLLDETILDVCASLAAGVGAYLVSILVVLLPIAPALGAWRLLGRSGHRPERLQARLSL